mgnify:CR=1 FL=1
MARNEIDLIDVAPLVALPILAGFVYGVWSLTLNVFGGFDFAQVLYSGHGMEISVALVGTIFSAGAIVVTNELDGSDYEQYEWMAIVAVLAMPVLYTAIPAVSSIIDGSDTLAFVVWLATAAVATYISYVE